MMKSLQSLATRQGKPDEAKRWQGEAVRVLEERQIESRLNIRIAQHPDDADALRRMAALVAKRGDYFGCIQFHAREMKQLADASAPLIATANDMKQSGYPDIAKQLAQKALQNSKTPEDRAAVEEFIQKILPQ